MLAVSLFSPFSALTMERILNLGLTIHVPCECQPRIIDREYFGLFKYFVAPRNIGLMNLQQHTVLGELTHFLNPPGILDSLVDFGDKPDEIVIHFSCIRVYSTIVEIGVDGEGVLMVREDHLVL